MGRKTVCLQLVGKPLSVMSAGGEIIVHDVSVVDDEDRECYVIGNIQSGVLRCEGTFSGVWEDGKLSAGFQYSEFYRSQIAVSLCAKLLIQFICCEPIFCHVLLDDLTVANNDRRFSADYGAESDRLQIEETQQHGKTKKDHDRQQSVCEGDSIILHRDGGKVGYDKCEDQFAGFKISDLAFSQQSQTDHKNDIENYCAKKRGCHKYTSLLREYLRNG